ncbi:winged helix-turn-helix transcriptional regulator [Caballeronia sp. 15711]|uniref:winged helix-turn-helix transcriptional regulator n=1 Tax=Caballeronia sp. 15711 TaxID=3391029 RepID=UPI0039E46FD0
MARKTLSKKYWLRIVEFEELQERKSIRPSSFDGMVCPIAGVIAAIGDRWGLLITCALVFGLKRYDDFRRSSGVTNATISDRLKYLEAHQLIERRLYQEHPPRYEYFPSKKGRDIGPVLMVLAELGDCWAVSGASVPPLIFANRKTGSTARWGILDHDTGEQLSGADISLKVGPRADDTMRWRLTYADEKSDKAVSISSSGHIG